MLKDNELIVFINGLIDLLNRKEAYIGVISEKSRILQTLGSEHKDPMPAYPKVNYEFSKRKFFLKAFAFWMIFLIGSGLMSELIGLFSKSIYGKLQPFIILLSPLCGIVTTAILEYRSKHYAINAANLSYVHAVELVNRQHTEDDIRVETELQRAGKIRSELSGWQEKLDFVLEIIDKSMKFADITEEHCKTEVLLIFVEYLRDGRCSTIYECKLKFDETMRLMNVVNGLQDIRMRINEFEDTFSQALHKADSYIRQQNEEARRLCRQQAEILDEIDYNQETTRKGLFMLSMLD